MKLYEVYVKNRRNREKIKIFVYAANKAEARNYLMCREHYEDKDIVSIQKLTRTMLIRCLNF